MIKVYYIVEMEQWKKAFKEKLARQWHKNGVLKCASLKLWQETNNVCSVY